MIKASATRQVNPLGFRALHPGEGEELDNKMKVVELSVQIFTAVLCQKLDILLLLS